MLKKKWISVLADQLTWYPIEEIQSIEVGCLVLTRSENIHLVGDAVSSSLKHGQVNLPWGGSGKQAMITHVAYIAELFQNETSINNKTYDPNNNLEDALNNVLHKLLALVCITQTEISALEGVTPSVITPTEDTLESPEIAENKG